MTTTNPGVGVAALSVTETASAATVPMGGTVTFTVRLSNAGPASATSIRLSGALGTWATLLRATVPGQGCAVSGHTASCSLGALAPGATATAVVAVMPTSAGSLTNSVKVAAQETDPSPANESVSVTVTVANATTVAKTVAPKGKLPVTGGSPQRYYGVAALLAGLGLIAGWRGWKVLQDDGPAPEPAEPAPGPDRALEAWLRGDRADSWRGPGW
ncbi:MAG: DUF11 domain-containing protein [Actinomycetota bacterium]